MRTKEHPSHDQSLGLLRQMTRRNHNKIITIVSNNYLKNIREELLEEEDNQLPRINNEIVHIQATVNGTITIIMIDTGSNISLSLIHI